MILTQFMPFMFTLWCMVTTLLFLDDKTLANSFSDHDTDNRTGIPPGACGDCRKTHPIKGNFTTYSGERCIYHLPGQHFYHKSRAERCYATETDARQDGCRKSQR